MPFVHHRPISGADAERTLKAAVFGCQLERYSDTAQMILSVLESDPATCKCDGDWMLQERQTNWPNVGQLCELKLKPFRGSEKARKEWKSASTRLSIRPMD